MRIEICGGIGSGKTTLAKLLGVNGYELIQENFRSNPFWEAFYQDPNSYQFETEVTFLLQHYHAVKTSAKNRNLVCEFSFIQDLAYAKLGLKTRRLKIFEEIFDEVISELLKPDLLICLDCEPTILLERIHARNRKEEQTISVDFLAVLNKYIYEETSVFNLKNNVLHINSKKINFYSDENGQRNVLERIEKSIAGIH